jgi:hypothetical protein
VEEVVVVEGALPGEGVDLLEPRSRSPGHRERGGSIQGHHRRGRREQQLVVERDDPAPIRVLGPACPRVAGGGGGLEGERAGRPPQAQRAVDQDEALGHAPALPAVAVPLLE